MVLLKNEQQNRIYARLLLVQQIIIFLIFEKVNRFLIGGYNNVPTKIAIVNSQFRSYAISLFTRSNSTLFSKY
jgi:hypothetical protein